MKSNRLIVFAPGWSDVQLYSNPLLAKFKDGFDILKIHYEWAGLRSIAYSARSSVNILSALLPSYDHATFIGHSMGGLIGRELIQTHNLPFQAYVSLGTPHSGSKRAKLGSFFSRAARDMTPGSEFLNKLNNAPWDIDIKALAIQACIEEAVLPTSSAEFDHAENVKVPWTTHASLIFSPRVYSEIWSWLTYDIFGEIGHTNGDGYESHIAV